VLKTNFRGPHLPKDIKTLIPKQTPTWGTEPGNESNAKATWLGYAIIYLGEVESWFIRLCFGYFYSHACYLVELPTPPGAARGVRIIFDPVFSKRCSPFQSLGPARFIGMSVA